MHSTSFRPLQKIFWQTSVATARREKALDHVSPLEQFIFMIAKLKDSLCRRFDS